MSLSRESIAGLALEARKQYAAANASFQDAIFPLIMHHDDYEPKEDWDRKWAEASFKEGLEGLVPLVVAGLEAIGSISCARDFSERVRQLIAKDVMDYEQHDQESDIFWSPILDLCGHYVKILEAAGGEALLLPAVEHELRLLERILGSTGEILSEHSIVPSNEAMVYNAVARHLRIAFPTFTRKITFHTPMKRYKPEFGVIELQAVIEYKLARDAEHIATLIEQLSGDVHGYKPSGEWKRFYAVVHLLSGSSTQERVDAQVASLGFPDWWHVQLTKQG